MLNCKLSCLVGDSIHIKHININFNNNQRTKLKMHPLVFTSLKCVCIKQFESLQIIKTIFVCINPLKVGSTENDTPTHRARCPTYVSLITNSQFIIIRFISVA